jgi:hypothetical protein
MQIKKRTLIIQACKDWIEKGFGDECFWEGWPDCPTEIIFIPNMVMEALNKK